MLNSLCRICCIFLPLVLILSAPTNAAAQSSAEQGRKVFERYKQAVVTVRVVIGVSYGGRETENEQEANAAVIAPDGLAVLALSAIDPMQLAEGYNMPANEMTTRIVSMHVILADGAEKPADVVLRDKELDLAFIRLTEKPAEPLPFVSMETPGQPNVLDEVVCIMQYGRVARRAHAVFMDRIEAVVEKPRLFYILGDHRARQVVCSPVFTLDGGFVGMGVMRLMTGASDSSPDNMMVIVVPAEQINAMLEQTPAVN